MDTKLAELPNLQFFMLLVHVLMECWIDQIQILDRVMELIFFHAQLTDHKNRWSEKHMLLYHLISLVPPCPTFTKALPFFFFMYNMTFFIILFQENP